MSIFKTKPEDYIPEFPLMPTRSSRYERLNEILSVAEQFKNRRYEREEQHMLHLLEQILSEINNEPLK